jgi:predicted DNA-binding transcriptional regulator AlpA
MGDRLLGVREAGPRLNLSSKTLQRMCTRGRSPVPARLTSAGWVFRESDITRYIDDLFAEPNPGDAQAAVQ